MTLMEEALILVELADRFIANQCWCREIRLQKAAYFLQKLI